MRSREYDEEETQAKQERDHIHNHQVNLNNLLEQHNQPSSVSSSRQWTSAFRNPRIVRVSKAFGGKDRHSKVCTVRGLRDRRIRLSVPTAIQLYDLQDRLGLSQPSKVIDWLLEEAKDDVDKLPPLQFPHGFNQMYPNLIFGESSSTSAFPGTNLGFLQSWDLGGSSSRTRSIITETTTTPSESFDLDKGKWIKQDENSNHQEHGFDMNHQFLISCKGYYTSFIWGEHNERRHGSQPIMIGPLVKMIDMHIKNRCLSLKQIKDLIYRGALTLWLATR